ncbi:MAG: DUF5671 domain-containing protein [Betaproteobacteria bacterium]
MAAVNDELIAFVRSALARGVPRPEIEGALKQAGWSPAQVSGALSAFAPIDFPVPVPHPRPELSARDAFLYLLLFTTLYIVAYNFGALLFEFVDRMIPDPASAAREDFGDAIRWSVSSLIVALPVFLYLSRITIRTIRADPNRRRSPVRRGLTYLTLFVGACVLIGDVVTLIYNFLGGDLTMRFVLKVVVVGAISGAIFAYYLSDLRLDEREVSS